MREFFRRSISMLLIALMVVSLVPQAVHAEGAQSGYKPTNVEVAKDGDNLIVTWTGVSTADSYKVYRAQSRFSQYEYIGDTSSTTYTDTNPNASKYSNYYKIVPYSGTSAGQESNPGSLEISMFGENTYVFAPTDEKELINSTVASVFQQQYGNQFGTSRYALAYKPGDYTKTDTIQMGYYTYLTGLGKTPYDVRLKNVETPAALPDDNVTCNFWVGIGNVTIADTDNTAASTSTPKEQMFRWGASQAAPARRLNVERKSFFQWEYQFYGDDVNKKDPINKPYASGGFIADSNFAQEAGSWSQQQYYYRNCHLPKGVYGVNWNQVLQGCTGVDDANTVDNLASGTSTPSKKTELISKSGRSNWDMRACTTVLDQTPEMREKPFLYFDTESDKYKVFIPAMRRNSQGISWSKDNMGEGTSISVDKYFYIARPEKDTAATINAELRKGRNIIFSPGVYHVSEPIKVTRANTVIMGMGMATIIPDNEETAIKISDVGGISVSDLILDAGTHSETLLIAGKEGCNKDHSENPTVLHDVFYRVGGTGSLASCDSCQVINSNDVIIDHTWIWRADHGENVGWDKNKSKNGLIVNGDYIVIYGLFVEHFQEYDIIWRGEKGRTYFLQNEKCYDPQDQANWMSHNGEKKGFAAYKVTNNVKEHYVVGMGIYDVFIYTNGASIYVDNAIEVPNTANVLIENACTVEIADENGPKVGINRIINGTAPGIRTGKDNNGGYAIQRLLSYQNGLSRYLPDYYIDPTGTTVTEQQGEQPSYDPAAEKDIKKDPKTKDNEKPLWEMTDKDYDDKMGEDYKDPDEVKPGNNNNNNIKDEGKKSDTVVENVKVGTKFTVGKYTYKVTKVSGKTGNVTLYTVVKKYRKKLKSASVKANVTFKGYKFNVTSVGKKSFKNCKKLKKVTVGKNVKTISSKAFYSSKKLKKITVKGKKLKKISKTAFNKRVRKTIKIKANKKVKKVILKSLKRKK